MPRARLLVLRVHHEKYASTRTALLEGLIPDGHDEVALYGTRLVCDRHTEAAQQVAANGGVRVPTCANEPYTHCTCGK